MVRILRLAFVGAVYAAGVVLWTLIFTSQPLPQLLWIPVFGWLPLGVVLFISHRKRRSANQGVDPSQARKLGRVAVIVAGMIAFAILAMLALVIWYPQMPLPPGQPQVFGGHYVVNNHGTLTTVTRDQYFYAVSAGQRVFATFAYFIYCSIALAIAISGDRRGWPRAFSKGNSGGGSRM